MPRRYLYLGLSIIATVVGFYYIGPSVENGMSNPPIAHFSPAEKAKAKTVQQPDPTAVAKPANGAKAVAEVAKEDPYSPSIVPENMTIQGKKKRFRALLVPAIDQVYREFDRRYLEVAEAIKIGADGARIEKLKVEYRAEDAEELLAALKPHPQSIALAQAAMESAWGTSRFFVRANNVFGVWSFDKDEPRIAAGEQRGDKTIWVKKYDSIHASVKDYYRVLARGDAFQDFRALRMKTDNPYELVKKLDRYSEKGEEYGKELTSMISFNKFGEYDDVFYERIQ
jgi:Bax protein